MSQGAYIALRDLARLRYQAKGFSYLPAQPVHSILSGRKRSRLRGRGLDFDELRHYRPGDDIRNMDWKVTRRTGAPFVRVYTEERDRPVWVVVDQRLSMFFGSRYQMKSVAAAEIAALTAWRVLGVGDRIGAVLFNDHDCQWFRPSRSGTATLGWFERLVKMNRELAAHAPWQPDSAGLARALEQLSRRIGHDGLVIIISDFEGWDERTRSQLKKLRHSNDVIATVVTDPLERDIEGAEKLVVSDGQFQLEVKPGKRDAGERFRADFQRRLSVLTDDLKRHSIPLIPISTESDVAAQIQRQLGGATARAGNL